MLERITVLRTFALSKLWYQANFVLLNESEIKKIETMCFKFIWNGSELIKRSTLLLDYTEGGLKMLDIRAKLRTISLRNFLYFKQSINRPQYQLCAYWLKFQLKDFIVNFNIFPGGIDVDRPAFYGEMMKNIVCFKHLYSKWAKKTDEKKLKEIESFNNKSNNKKVFKPIEPNFLKNVKVLTSKFIYNLLSQESKKPIRLGSGHSDVDRINFFHKLHSVNLPSDIRVINYKVVHNGLATNKKFNNRYDNHLCNKITDEDLSHIFGACIGTSGCFDYIRG